MLQIACACLPSLLVTHAEPKLDQALRLSLKRKALAVTAVLARLPIVVQGHKADIVWRLWMPSELYQTHKLYRLVLTIW